MAHKHATEMLQYAQDAAETDKPWERWEAGLNGVWEKCCGHPAWDKGFGYRRIAERVTFEGKLEWLAPLSEAPERGKSYWVIDTSLDEPVAEYTWHEDGADGMFYARGLAFATEEAARECWAAMQKFLDGGAA